jgi:hypothetical protein
LLKSCCVALLVVQLNIDTNLRSELSVNYEAKLERQAEPENQEIPGDKPHSLRHLQMGLAQRLPQSGSSQRHLLP